MLNLATTHSSHDEINRLKRAFYLVLFFTAILWCIKIVEIFLNLNFGTLGVHPDNFFGLMGVFTAPLIHGSLEHLIANTPAIIILGTALIYGYPRSCWIVIPVIWIGTELGVWFTARPVFHFGASGLTYGSMFFIFVVGIIRKERQAIALSLLVFFLYGTMIWGIFPHQSGVSFESHLWGAAMGILCAILLHKRDPLPPIKRYDWEIEEDDDPVMREAWNQFPEKGDFKDKD